MPPKKQKAAEAEVTADSSKKSPVSNGVRPKKPSAPYLFFNVETAKKIREKNSELTNTEVFQKVSQVW